MGGREEGAVEMADSFILPRVVTGREPQHLLITLLGDYWRGQREMIPSSALADLLAEFGVSEASARQAMRRLRNRDLLVQSKIGRQTYYGTPDRVAGPSAERRKRVFSFGLDFTDWDQEWTVLAFSIPEKERDVRRQLRHKLSELKFGMLYDAVWISPHNRVDAALALLETFEVGDATVMRSKIVPRPGHDLSFAEVFGIDELGQRYEEFADRLEPLVERVRDGRVSPSEALVLRTEVMSSWLNFRRSDPNLPFELLPSNWPRRRARELTYGIYDELGAAAEARFRQIVARADRELAQLASHHTSHDGL